MPDRRTSRATNAFKPKSRRLTVSMICTALLSTALLLIVGDAMGGGLLYALLHAFHATTDVILWTEGTFLVLSVVPAGWLLYRACQAEMEMADPNGRRPAED